MAGAKVLSAVDQCIEKLASSRSRNPLTASIRIIPAVKFSSQGYKIRQIFTRRNLGSNNATQFVCYSTFWTSRLHRTQMGAENISNFGNDKQITSWQYYKVDKFEENFNIFWNGTFASSQKRRNFDFQPDNEVMSGRYFSI